MRRMSDNYYAPLIFDGGALNERHGRTCLGPLTQSAGGFQYLDYEDGGEMSAVVTTYPDGTF